MKKYNLLFLFLSVISLKAQNVSRDSIRMAYTADEVVIESFKQNNHLALKPVSASLLTAKDIKEKQISTIKDFTALVPNLFIPDYGVKLSTPVYIRGIGSRINSPSVGLYIDGVPYFDRSSFDFNMNDIERVEFLRGPQGTIYGRNTMGGTINVYTKSPFKYHESNLSLSAGNYNNYRVDASHYGNINQTLGYSFSGNYMHNGGYFNNIYKGKKADGMDATSARIRLSWRIRPRLVAHLSSTYEYSDQDGYPYGIYDIKTNTTQDVNYNGDTYYRRNMSTTGLELAYVTDQYKLSSQTSFQYLDGNQGIDQDFTDQSLYYVLFSQRQRMYSQEFNWKSITNSRYQWVFGTFAFYQNYSNMNNVATIAKNTHNIKDITNPSKGIAFYHQSTINDVLTKGLSLVMGIRYDWEKIKMQTNETNIDKDGIASVKNPVKGRDDYSQVTANGSVQYMFAKNKMTYFTVSRGYKAGGFNTTADTEEDRSFKPEYSWSYELGTKVDIIDHLIHTDFSLFYIDWTDQQISQTKPNKQGNLLRNAGKTVSKGFEASIVINPFRNLSTQINYGYTHAKFDKYEDKVKGVDYSGNYLPLVPTNTFSVSADYTIQLNTPLIDKIGVNAQYIGIGKLYWNEDNLAEQPYYNTINGRLSFVKDKISVDLWAKNINNEKYITYYFSSMGNTFAQRGKPFTCGVSINCKL